MRAGRLVCDERGISLPARACECWWERLRGLRGAPPLAPDEALLIEPCFAVHTLGMRYAIDVVLCDRSGRVLRIASDVRPAAIAGDLRAHAAWELRAGAAGQAGLRRGDRLWFAP